MSKYQKKKAKTKEEREIEVLSAKMVGKHVSEEKGKALLNVIESLNEVCLKIISVVMYCTPIGIGTTLYTSSMLLILSSFMPYFCSPNKNIIYLVSAILPLLI